MVAASRSGTTAYSAARAHHVQELTMQQLVSELDLTIALLEAELPANPTSPKNQRLEGGLERDLRRYFRALERAMPMEKINVLYSSQVEQ